jgi:ATP synthase protein I
LKVLPAKSKITSKAIPLILPDSGEGDFASTLPDIALKAEDSIAEYERLKQRLLISTLTIAVLGFAIAWLNYGLNIGLNYLLGACVGTLYLRQLAKSVDRMGASGAGFQFGSPRIAIFIALMIVATRWKQLSFLPVFLGFLTYKLAILIYAIQIFFADSDSQ